jgi:hypothetical protein
LVELLHADQPLLLDPAGARLRDCDAVRYGRRTVWPAWMMQAAFTHLLQWRLVTVHAVGGHCATSIDYGRLVDVLREERRRQLANPDDVYAARALTVFRSRKLLTKASWLDQLMADVNVVEAAAIRARGPHGTAGGAREHA